MGWLFAIFFVIYYFISRDPSAIIAAGLFALAGELGFVRVDIDKLIEKKERL